MPDPPLASFPEFPGIPPIGEIDPLSPIAGILPIRAFMPVMPAIQTKDPKQNEFRLDGWPPKVQQLFSNKGGDSWLKAVDGAIGAGIQFRNSSDLADLIFFMQHPERMTAGVGKLIDKNEEDFFKLRAEWDLCRTIATRRLDPSAKPTVFLSANPSNNYEDYVAAQTTGHITLMVNGRNQGGSGDIDNQVETFNSMQQTVESLGPNDSVYIANWQFTPTEVPLTKARTDLSNWGELLESKAKEGVKIRIIVADLPPLTPFMSNLTLLEAIVGKLSTSTPDNFKYIVSPHPNNLVGSHHQKFMVVKKGKTILAYCGGLDISFNRTPAGWLPAHGSPPGSPPIFVWHDIGAKLEGLIARDLEREFVLRWNREKDKSTAKKLPGWKDFEKLVQTPVKSVDKERGKNPHKLQMLRTVSVGMATQDIRRDDIWQGYFRLIGRATRFIFLENQYFHEPKMADAIVLQAQAQPDLIIIVVVSTGTDDPQTVDPKSTGFDRVKQQAAIDYVQNGLALRHEFFNRLFVGLGDKRLRVYTMFYPKGLVHSKLILVDDQALSIGSANANPRGFFMDTELNVMLDDTETVKNFRQQLWSHDLGILPAKVAEWKISEFFAQWDTVADFNKRQERTPEKMVGEGVIGFKPWDPSDPRAKNKMGKRGPIRLPFPLPNINPAPVLF